MFHRHPKVQLEKTLLHKNKLWSQKFYRANLDEWTLAKLSNRPGEIYESSYLEKAINYIKNNRFKHGLVESGQLNKLINEFAFSVDKAYDMVE